MHGACGLRRGEKALEFPLAHIGLMALSGSCCVTSSSSMARRYSLAVRCRATVQRALSPACRGTEMSVVELSADCSVWIKQRMAADKAPDIEEDPQVQRLLEALAGRDSQTANEILGGLDQATKERVLTVENSRAFLTECGNDLVNEADEFANLDDVPPALVRAHATGILTHYYMICSDA